MHIWLHFLAATDDLKLCMAVLHDIDMRKTLYGANVDLAFVMAGLRVWTLATLEGLSYYIRKFSGNGTLCVCDNNSDEAFWYVASIVCMPPEDVVVTLAVLGNSRRLGMYIKKALISNSRAVCLVSFGSLDVIRWTITFLGIKPTDVEPCIRQSNLIALRNKDALEWALGANWSDGVQLQELYSPRWWRFIQCVLITRGVPFLEWIVTQYSELIPKLSAVSSGAVYDKQLAERMMDLGCPILCGETCLPYALNLGLLMRNASLPHETHSHYQLGFASAAAESNFDRICLSSQCMRQFSGACNCNCIAEHLQCYCKGEHLQ